MGSKPCLHVTFRFDDPSAVSDHSLETEILARFRKHAVPLTVAVIPFRNREGKAELERADIPHLITAHDEGLIEVALHGYRHVSNQELGAAPPSEFVGRGYSEQAEMLRSGRATLEKAFQTEIYGFVPPWNTFDQNTLSAAAQLGFRYIGSGVGAGRAHTPDGVPVVPKTCSMRERDVKRVMKEGIRFSHYGPWAIFVFHPDNFVEFRDSPQEGEGAPWLSLDSLDTVLEMMREHGAEACTLGHGVRLSGRTGRYWDTNELHWVNRYSYRLYSSLPRHILLPGTRGNGLLAIARTALFHRDP